MSSSWLSTMESNRHLYHRRLVGNKVKVCRGRNFCCWNQNFYQSVLQLCWKSRRILKHGRVIVVRTALRGTVPGTFGTCAESRQEQRSAMAAVVLVGHWHRIELQQICIITLSFQLAACRNHVATVRRYYSRISIFIYLKQRGFKLCRSDDTK